ncbi:MICAL-like protein 1 [Pollicipes pollicipes]|uniref:MICAL-like protein 1 n=1 Tax=Pollicipes pollicipes TaxID=41117 RepID=UPI0018856AC2|nr:MICAL-like protein 1 [Pollicipes pollicipes]
MGERRGMKALELWCRRITKGYPGVRITNMTTSWRNGLGFCAIIHHFRPDLIDFDSLRPDDVYKNNALAFETAETSLSVPALLDPQDMVDYEVPDRLSILTYVSQFYQAFVGQQGVPRKPVVESETASPDSASPADEKHVATSVRQREPCAACRLPVFLAERMLIERRLVHRTCFKCARCGSQLSTANYYVTEDAQFCCEVCPDEEIGGRVQKTAAVLAHERAVLAGPADDPLSEDADAVLELELRPPDPAAGAAPRRPPSSASSSSGDSDSDSESSEPAATETQVVREADVAIPDSDDGQSGASVAAEGRRSEAAPEEAAANGTAEAARATDAGLETVAAAATDSQPVGEAGGESESVPAEPESVPVESEPVPTEPEPVPAEPEPAIRSRGAGDGGAPRRHAGLARDTPPEADRGREPAAPEEAATLGAGEVPAPASGGEEEVPLTEERRDGEERLGDEDGGAPGAEGGAEKQDSPVKEPRPDEPANPFDDDDDDEDEAEEAPAEKPSAVPTVEITEPTPTKPAEAKEYNPFDEDEEEEEEVVKTKPEETVEAKAEEEYPDDLNPFGDDGEDDAPPVAPPQPPKPAEASLNPFGDDEDEEETGSGFVTPVSSTQSSPSKPVSSPREINPFEKPPRPPPPTLDRRVLAARAAASTPPRPAEPPGLVREQRSGSLTSLTSSSGKKKRPAPRPPGLSSPSASQGVSPVDSPATLRKRHAPPPPPVGQSSPGNPEAPPNPERSKAEKEQDNYTKMNLTNKSIQGKFKRRKGPAPLRPKPIKRQVKTLPPKETQTELHDINVKQLELERQGVELEKTIRQLTELEDKQQKELDSTAPYGLDIEDMILQLFDLVNEKNALFRRQAELMYMRRQHRLEEEHAELEYEIRCLMMKADSLKTEPERQREQQLIDRLVSVVEQRNEIVTMLEMERIREIQEDASIDYHMGLYTAERVGSAEPTPEKKKKDKKKKKKKDKEKKEKERSGKKKRTRTTTRT